MLQCREIGLVRDRNAKLDIRLAMLHVRHSFQESLWAEFGLAALFVKFFDFGLSIELADILDGDFQHFGDCLRVAERPSLDGFDRKTDGNRMYGRTVGMGSRPAVFKIIKTGGSLSAILVCNRDGPGTAVSHSQFLGGNELVFQPPLGLVQRRDVSPSERNTVGGNLGIDSATQCSHDTCCWSWMRSEHRRADIVATISHEEDFHGVGPLTSSSSPNRYHNSPGANSLVRRSMSGN